MSEQNVSNYDELLQVLSHEMCHQAVDDIDGFKGSTRNKDIHELPEMPYQMNKRELDWAHGKRLFEWDKRVYEKTGIEVHRFINNKKVIKPVLVSAFTRRDYLKHYNINDVEIMKTPIINLINFAFEYSVDLLQNFSLASVAIAIRYVSLYKDFKIDVDYSKYHDVEIDGEIVKENVYHYYYFSKAKCRSMCYRYLKQDETAKRGFKRYVNENDYEL
jgi:hypothetical protein